MTEFLAVFDFGSGVKGRMSFRTKAARHEVMEHALEGREEEGNWEVTTTPNGERRKLRTAVAAYAVETVSR